MKHLIITQTLLAWLVSIAWVSAANAQEEKLIQYTVQPNDTCWSIAQKLYGDGKKYSIIHRFNELGPLPHILKPGAVLTLPQGNDVALGKLNWIRKNVEAKPPTTDWLNARQDMPLWRLYRVRTGESASAGIEFEDRTQLSMKEQALLVVYGPGAGKSRLKRRVKNKVSLEKGSIRGGLAQLDEAASLQVNTPSGKVQLNSRDANIEVDKLKTAAISVYDGQANVSAKGNSVSVKDGEGTTVKKGKPPAKPKPLPKPPAWLGDTQNIVLVSTPGATNQFQLEWSPVPSAARYRVELAHDDTFRKVLSDAEVGSGVLSFAAKELLPGDYFVRVSTIAEDRLQSRASQTASIRIVEISPSRIIEAHPSGELLVVGWLKLDLPKEIGKNVEVAINDGAFKDGNSPIRLFDSGVYTLRFRAKGSQFESKMVLNVLAIDAGFDIPAESSPLSRSAVIELYVKDSKGRPSLLPGLEVVANGDTKLMLTQLSAGRYSVTVPPTPGGTAIEAMWVGGVISEATVPFESAKSEPLIPKDTPLPPISWPYTPIKLSWSAPASDVTARGAQSFSNVNVAFTTARAPQGSKNETLYLQTDLGAQLGLAGNRFSLDARLSMFNTPLNEDHAGEPVLDNLKLGIRTSSPMLSGDKLFLSSSFRLTLPTRQRTDIPQRQIIFEPALLLEWAAHRKLHFGFNQVFVLTMESSDYATAISYASFLDTEYRIIKHLGFAIQGILHVTQPNFHNNEETPIHSFIGGAAVRLYIDRLRITLVSGRAFNNNAKELFGAYSVGLNLHLLLGE